jgi:hypothetical protein
LASINRTCSPPVAPSQTKPVLGLLAASGTDGSRANLSLARGDDTKPVGSNASHVTNLDDDFGLFVAAQGTENGAHSKSLTATLDDVHPSIDDEMLAVCGRDADSVDAGCSTVSSCFPHTLRPHPQAVTPPPHPPTTNGPPDSGNGDWESNLGHPRKSAFSMEFSIC